MRPVPLVFALFAAGCAPSNPHPDRTDPTPAPRPASRLISVGQPYAAAEATARAAGYAPHDARGLAWASPGPNGEVGVDGFYLQLPHDTDLIVFRDPQTNTVAALHLVANASKPKSQRTHPPVGDSFELPPQDGASD